MNRKDIVKICVQNLLRRKARTMLTVLGVVIGCCAIVIMVSIGIGMKESQDKMLAEMGDLTIITVTSPTSGNQKAKLDQKALAAIRALPAVDVVTPKLSFEESGVKVMAGSDRRFVTDRVTIVGMEPEAIEKLGFRLLEGSFPKKGDKKVLVGQYMEYSFKDSLRPEGKNMMDRYEYMWQAEMAGKKVSIPKAYFDAMKQPLTLEVELKEGKKMSFPLPVEGRLKEDYGKGYESSDGIVVPLSYMEEIVKSLGTQKGNAPRYQNVLVKVKSINQVAEVEDTIKSMGLQTYSMESIRKPLEKEARQKQMMLGGLGAISLLVAAIGITNTMIMSISERTREIGIMKALGCYIHDIRVIFLAEAGAIGLIGGILGSIISFLISMIMNVVAARGATGSESVSRISIIPPWLILFAIVFSVGIGLGSGYYPANKAVRIPALEAIKNE